MDKSEHRAENGMGGHYDAFVRRFMGQDEKIAEIKEQQDRQAPEHRRIMIDLYNGDDPKTGFIAEVRDSISRQNERALLLAEGLAAKDKRDNRRANIAIAIMTVIGVLVSILLYLHTIEDGKRGLLKWPQFNGLHGANPVYARWEKPPQDAAN